MAYLEAPIVCDHVGCGAHRTATNKWFVVHVEQGRFVTAYWWDYAEEIDRMDGHHFCGVGHAMHFISAQLHFGVIEGSGESTLILRPPLTREGGE